MNSLYHRNQRYLTNKFPSKV